MTPQLTLLNNHNNPTGAITLDANGDLQLELPGHNGHRQLIPLTRRTCYDAIMRHLKEQALSYEVEAYLSSHTANTYDDSLEKLFSLRAKNATAIRQRTLKDPDSYKNKVPVSKRLNNPKPLTQADLGI